MMALIPSSAAIAVAALTAVVVASLAPSLLSPSGLADAFHIPIGSAAVAGGGAAYPRGAFAAPRPREGRRSGISAGVAAVAPPRRRRPNPTTSAARRLRSSAADSDGGDGGGGRPPAEGEEEAAAPSPSSAASSASAAVAPQVFATGYSPKPDLLEAIQEATEGALRSLPPPPPAGPDASSIDLALVAVSSLYDGQTSPSVVVPAVLSSASTYGDVRHLIGCTAGGIVSSSASVDGGDRRGGAESGEGESAGAGAARNRRECVPVESEGVPGVSVTLCLLPDVDVKTFHVLEDDVPDDVGRISSDTWKAAVGLRGWGGRGGAAEAEEGEDPPAFMLLPSPAFQTSLDDFLRGLSYAFPSCTTFGGIASTVSSLSRARLFRHDASDPQCVQTVGEGCVGVALRGDVEVRVMVAQGAKPVGGIYRVVSGSDSTVGVIMLDEAATAEEDEASEEEEEEEEELKDAKARAAAAYAKARIPKPVLAEANYLMKALSDDDRSFMRKAILIGLERGGSMGRTPNELARLASGEGHRFAVHQVASAGMKDGSVTLPLGSVDVRKGQRLRFFVREGGFARREVEALWTGYKKRALESSLAGGAPFEPTGVAVLTTLDRGTKLFGGKPGYESGVASTFLPTAPSISGFFSNGVLGRLDETDSAADDVMVHGSAACYAVFGSKTKRPVFSPAAAAAAAEADARKRAEEDAAAAAVEEDEDDDERRAARAKDALFDPGAAGAAAAPRSDDGELVLRRREVHSGRAISVSTVEWSVAEKTATPTSALEGFMWDKEAEVDRFRERVPLSNLVSQCKLSASDPAMPKPRDWIGPVREAGAGGAFVIVPECKRTEPTTGSLRKRYDLPKLVRQLTAAGAPAISVNCDAVLFGGSLEDVTRAREASSKEALSLASSAAAAASESDDALVSGDGVVPPPILASDLLLYPYQLYKLRLAGADAVNLVVGALESKDLLYLTKIAASLKMQMVASAASEVQIRAVGSLSRGSVSALVLSNRELEDFSFDMTGERVLSLLRSEALAEFRERHGEDVPVLVDGRVGIIERPDESGEPSSGQYLKELKEAGAFGAIVGGGLVAKGVDNGGEAYEMLTSECK